MNEYKIYRIRNGKLYSEIVTTAGDSAESALRKFLSASPQFFTLGEWAAYGDRYLVLQTDSGAPEGRVFTVEPPMPVKLIVTEVGF